MQEGKPMKSENVSAEVQINLENIRSYLFFIFRVTGTEENT